VRDYLNLYTPLPIIVKQYNLHWDTEADIGSLAVPTCVYTEDSNITSKCNGVTRYGLCNVLRVITFRRDKSSTFDRVIALGCDNGSNELESITFLHYAKRNRITQNLTKHYRYTIVTLGSNDFWCFSKLLEIKKLKIFCYCTFYTHWGCILRKNFYISV
jgi:hypothetical protein